MLETKILQYLDYSGDSEYIALIVTAPDAVDTLIKLLKSNNHEIVGYTCFFIRDFVLSISESDTCKQLWETKLESAIIPELEYLVLADNHFIRKHIIYTLGKICSYNSVPVLLHAFSELRDRDPILLPRLVGELFWLGVKNRHALIESMTASNQYITRWSVVEALNQFIYDSKSEDETFLMRYKFCDLLRWDSNSLVQAEAEYEYQYLELNRRKHKTFMSKLEYKTQNKELNKIKPFLLFSGVENHFYKYMYEQNLHWYSIQELEDFILDLSLIS